MVRGRCGIRRGYRDRTQLHPDGTGRLGGRGRIVGDVAQPHLDRPRHRGHRRRRGDRYRRCAQRLGMDLPVPGDQFAHERHQAWHGRMVIHGNGIDVQTERPVHLAHQLDRADRVQPHLAEAEGRVYLRPVEVQAGAQHVLHDGGDRGVLWYRRFNRYRRARGGAEPVHLREVLPDEGGRLGAEHLVVHCRLTGDHRPQPVQRATGEVLLEHPDRQRRLLRHRAGQRERGRQHVGLWRERDAGTAPRQLVAGERPAGVEHLGRDRRTEALLQHIGRAHARREAVFQEVGAVDAFPGQHHEVGVQREGEPAARRVPADGGDHRTVAAQHALVHERRVGEPAPATGQGFQRLRRRAHAEHLVGTRDHDRAYPVVVGDAGERVLQAAHHVLGEHVAAAGGAHRQHRDTRV